MVLDMQTSKPTAELIQNEPFAMYQARAGINASAIKRGRLSPKHMRHALTEKEPPVTPAMIWGTLTHTAVLVGLDGFAAYDGKVKRGKEYDAFVAENDGKECILASDLAELHNMRESVMANRKAREIIEATDHEVSCTWPSEWGTAKCRFDCVSPRYVADLKSTSKIVPRDFESQAYGLGYHIQMAWYYAGARECGYNPEVYIIAVESAAPYDTIVYGCDEEWMERGMKEASAALNAYTLAQKSGDFHGIAEDVRIIALPTWAAELPDPRNMTTIGASEL